MSTGALITDPKGVYYTFKFNNGYGASVAKHRHSRGHEKDLWELAALDYSKEKNGEIAYDHFDGIIGHLTSEAVFVLLETIRNF